MPNMSYCMFENTFGELQQCYEALSEAESVEELEKETNKRDKKYIKKLIDLCIEIAEGFGDEVED